MIYTCDDCRYTFEWIGAAEQCPDCGKRHIRKASEKEKADYLAYSEEKCKGMDIWK